jgi:hypothetical protein
MIDVHHQFFRLRHLLVQPGCLRRPLWPRAGKRRRRRVNSPSDSARPRSRSRIKTTGRVSLDALLKKGPVAVVFIRSVDWCVYCQLQAIELQRNLKEIEGWRRASRRRHL